ncbi:TonB-dependent receptor [Flavisolibacter tropicus]|nr:TonB-dependent receptor [Flavisolibacter tropicus]
MRLLLSSFIFFFCQTLLAQTTLTGIVKDAKQNAIPGASISLKETYDGATSDSTGRFSFKSTEKGEQVLVVTAIGYKPFEQKLLLQGSNQQVTITLKEDVTELKAVVISAGAFEASDRKKTTVLNPIDIVTTASANADVTGALKTLPGAQQVGESEGLFVRGGTAAETKTFIDGTLVNNFFYSSIPNVATRGRFNPFIFKGTVFSTGGYSALYGQALSSAVILESIDLPEQSSANLGVSVIGLSGGYQQLAKDKRSSWGVSYGYTNLWLAFKAIKQRQDFSQIPIYHTADANFRIKTSRTGMLKYYGYFSTNKLGFTEPSIDTLGFNDAFRLSNFNMYHNLSYKESLNNGWKIIVGTSFTNNKDDIEGYLQNGEDKKVVVEELERKNFALDSKSSFVNGRLVLEKKLQGLSMLRFGGEYNYSNEKPIITTYNGAAYKNSLVQNVSAAFAESDIYITNNMAAKIGTRAEYASVIDKINIAPRVSLAYKLGTNSQASVAYGIFYQNPENRYLPAITDLQFAKATHYIAQYQKIASDRTLRAEVFYKKYDNLIKTDYRNNREVAINSKGYGEASGFDFFWRDKKTFKQFDYWISYSYLDTKRDFINYPQAIQPSFAARHTGSLVVKKFVSKLKTQFNGSYTYASGRPYYNISYDNTTSKFSIMDQGRTIDYNSLSLSVNYLPNVFKQGGNKFTVLVFSINNVLNSKQVYGYKYSYNGYRKEAITPSSKMFVFIGAFISFGVDRTQDVINNNL